jgi:hypothetical protein
MRSSLEERSAEPAPDQEPRLKAKEVSNCTRKDDRRKQLEIAAMRGEPPNNVTRWLSTRVPSRIIG